MILACLLSIIIGCAIGDVVATRRARHQRAQELATQPKPKLPPVRLIWVELGPDGKEIRRRGIEGASWLN